MSPQDRQHYLIEYAVFGRYLKATAIDPNTGEEASVQGDARAPREGLGRMAIRKLQRQQAGN